MNLWWAPGQSEPTREICRHLNGKEKAQIYFLSFLFGLCSFAIPLLLFSVMGLGPFDGFPVGPGFALLLVICLALGAWFIPGLQRRILLSTQFAKSNGFTMVDLARSPLSRGDYLALGGFAVLVATLGMAGSFMAWFLYIGFQPPARDRCRIDPLVLHSWRSSKSVHAHSPAGSRPARPMTGGGTPKIMRIDPIGHLLPPKPPKRWMYVLAWVVIVVAIAVTIFGVDAAVEAAMQF